MNTVDYWLDESFLVEGDYELVDDSFDHEFGTLRRNRIEVVAMRIFAYLCGTQIDVTEDFKNKNKDGFERIKMQVIKAACEHYLSVV